jgi:hypothetical protein
VLTRAIIYHQRLIRYAVEQAHIVLVEISGSGHNFAYLVHIKRSYVPQLLNLVDMFPYDLNIVVSKAQFNLIMTYINTHAGQRLDWFHFFKILNHPFICSRLPFARSCLLFEGI